jgi:hypothetical protein
LHEGLLAAAEHPVVVLATRGLDIGFFLLAFTFCRHLRVFRFNERLRKQVGVRERDSIGRIVVAV